MTSPSGPSTLSSISSLGQSFCDGSPIAQAAIDRDIENDSDDDIDYDAAFEREDFDRVHTDTEHSFVGSYNQSSFRGSALPPLFGQERGRSTAREREEALREERSLLRDNNIIPPKHLLAKRPQSKFWGIPRGDGKYDEEAGPEAAANAEATPLLRSTSEPYGGEADPENISRKWEEAILAGAISTSWQREAKVIARSSAPLMLTFLLQYSLTVASIFTVGHISSTALGAVTLGSMTANIFGYAIYMGMATSLDTLCAQAYGSGRKKLVGLQFQRMVYFLWALTIPITIFWLLADHILIFVIPERDVAELAGLYLKVLAAGAPGYALFEASKRYLQAQGIFSASLYVLMFVTPFNAFMNWFFVWYLELGFVGAPIAVAISDHLLWMGLFLYVYFVDGRECWNGFTRRALQNWGPMVRLALPGFVMVEAECLAFELLTFAASYLGVTTLAAQSVLATLGSLTFQIPFSLSIATSTRVANLVGATLVSPAKTSAKVGLCFAAVVGCINVIALSSLKNLIPRLFTDDPEVIATVSAILPLCAAFQLFDALAANCNGILRGLGRQEIGGYVQLFCYYVVAMPISFGTAFGLGWGLWGLWTGVAIALGLVAGIEAVFLVKTSWEHAVEDAWRRNESA